MAGGVTAASAAYGYLESRAYKPPFDTGKVADQIANGHAWAKHGQQFASLGIGDEGDFAKFIKKILDKPSKVKKLLRGRTAFWDSNTDTIVIRDPHNPDGGTAFRPSSGIKYFRNLGG